MPPSLFFLAAADQLPRATNTLSGIDKLLSDFGIDWPLLLAQVLCFSIVAMLLWKFAFKPVLATMEERQRQIESGLKYAEDTKAKLAANPAGERGHHQTSSARGHQVHRGDAQDRQGISRPPAEGGHRPRQRA